MEMNSERVVTLPQLQNITLHCELGEKVQWYINDNPMMNVSLYFVYTVHVIVKTYII